MLASLSKELKHWFRGCDRFGLYPSLGVKKTSPTFSSGLLISLLYHCIILGVLYQHLGIIFQKRTHGEYMMGVRDKAPPFTYMTGVDFNLTLKYSSTEYNPGDVKEQQNGQFILRSGYNSFKFQKSSGNTLVLESGKLLESDQLLLLYDGEKTTLTLNPSQIEISLVSLKDRHHHKNRLITIEPRSISANSSITLTVSIDQGIYYKDHSLSPWYTITSTPGLTHSPHYQLSLNNSSLLLRIVSTETVYSKLEVVYKITDLMANIGCLVCLMYFLSLYLCFDCTSRAEYLAIANRMYVLKYSNQKSIVYENISERCGRLLSCGRGIENKLTAKSILKVREKFDICRIIKQLRNIEVLVSKNQVKITNETMKNTVSTMNPYYLSIFDKQRILQFMQLGDILPKAPTPYALKPPLSVSIFNKLNNRAPHHSLPETHEPAPISPPKSRNPLKMLLNFAILEVNYILTNMDIFAYRVSFFLDETSCKVKSSLSGLLSCVSIWLTFLFTIQITISFLASTHFVSSATHYSPDCNRNVQYSQILMFVQNTTTGEFIPLNQFAKIAMVSSTSNNQSHGLLPLESPAAHKQYHNFSHLGAVFQTAPQIASCGSSFNLQFSYICPGNSNCEEMMYCLQPFTIHLLLPTKSIQTSTNTPRSTLHPFKFRYEYNPHRPTQRVFLKLDEIQTHTKYSFGILSDHRQVGFEINPDESRVEYLAGDRPLTSVELFLTDKIQKHTFFQMSVEEYIGYVGGVWCLVTVICLLFGRYINYVVMRMELVRNKEIKWSSLISFIFTKGLGRRQAKVSKEILSIREAELKGEELLSLERISQRLEIIEQYIQWSLPSEEERVLLNTYLKEEISKTKDTDFSLPLGQLPRVTLMQCSKTSKKIENIVMHHHAMSEPHPLAKSLWKNLNRMNIFSSEADLNYKGRTKISSTFTKLCTLGVVAIVVTIALLQVGIWLKRGSLKEYIQPISLESMTTQGLQLCVTLEKRDMSRLQRNLMDYIFVSVENNGTTHSLQRKEGKYCLLQESSNSSLFPLDITISQNSQQSDQPYFLETTQELLLNYQYSVCVTNYRFNGTVSSDNLCTPSTSFRQRVVETTVVEPSPQRYEDHIFYSFSWNGNQKSYQLRDGNVLARYTFRPKEEGSVFIYEKESVMSLLRKITGVIFIALLMVPLGRKYNQTKFILMLSKDLFLVSGGSLHYSPLDIILVMILSSLQSQCLISRRNNPIINTYLQVRQILSYKAFLGTLTSVENKISKETDPSFSVMLKTYIKPEIYLQSNINKQGFMSKVGMIAQLRETHTYRRLKELGLNDNEVLAVVSVIQNKCKSNNTEVERRIKFFRSHLSVD